MKPEDLGFWGHWGIQWLLDYSKVQKTPGKEEEEEEEEEKDGGLGFWRFQGL